MRRVPAYVPANSSVSGTFTFSPRKKRIYNTRLAVSLSLGSPVGFPAVIKGEGVWRLEAGAIGSSVALPQNVQVLNFGSVAVGASGSLTYPVVNNSRQPMIMIVNIVQPASEFGPHPAAAASLRIVAPGATWHIPAKFSPTAVGQRPPGTLVVAGMDPFGAVKSHAGIVMFGKGTRRTSSGGGGGGGGTGGEGSGN